MLFVFACTALGLVSSYRIYLKMIAENVFTKKQMTNFGTFYLLFILIALICLKITGIFYSFLIFSPQILIFGIGFIVKRMRKRNFQNIFISFLEVLLMKMYIGASFRESFAETKLIISKKYQDFFSQIEEFVVFPQRDLSKIKDPFIREIIYFFRKVDQNSHNNVQRIEFYFDQCKLKEKFRRKSSVITTQSRLQTIVLVCMYVVLSAFQILKFGFYGLEYVYLVSFFIFSLGLLTYGLVFKRQFQCIKT